MGREPGVQAAITFDYGTINLQVSASYRTYTDLIPSTTTGLFQEEATVKGAPYGGASQGTSFRATAWQNTDLEPTEISSGLAPSSPQNVGFVSAYSSNSYTTSASSTFEVSFTLDQPTWIDYYVATGSGVSPTITMDGTPIPPPSDPSTNPWVLPGLEDVTLWAQGNYHISYDGSFSCTHGVYSGPGVNLGFEPFSLTITTEPAVTTPEPTTLIVWSLLGGIGLAFGYWRRKRAA